VYQTLLKKIAEVFQEHDIPYIIIGGQAVLLYGEPRLTKDIDVTLGMGVDRLNEVQNAVEILELKQLLENVEDFVSETMVMPTVEESSGIRVDFIFSFSPYERQAIERATAIQIDEVAVRFATLEDVIIQKVIAGRARDLEDIRSILLKNPDYDREYIKRWIAEFDKALDEKYSRLFDRIELEIKSSM
jgi:predicted nucleotidyltransferase